MYIGAEDAMRGGAGRMLAAVRHARLRLDVSGVGDLILEGNT
jgi:hypothetical protein